MGPKNTAVFNITRNFPPVTASRAFLEREACFFKIQFLTLALVLVPEQKNIASHDKGIVKATLIKVALTIPKILVVAINDPSAKMNPNMASNIPAAQYNLLLAFPPIFIFFILTFPNDNVAHNRERFQSLNPLSQN